MRTICSERFSRKYRQQQNYDSDLKEAWHYNHVTFTRIAKNFMLYCRLIYMLSMLYVRLTIVVQMGIPDSFKVGWYPHKITGSSHLKWYLDSIFNAPYSPKGSIALATMRDKSEGQMAPFCIVDIPIPFSCLPNPPPKNQCCMLDPQVFLLLQTTLNQGVGGFMAFKRNEIINELNVR